MRRITQGGFPEAATRSPARRRAWFGSYISTLLQREVRDLADIEGLTELPRLLALLASRSAQLMNVAELSRTSGLPQSTLKRYLALLEATYLLERLPAWSANRGKQLVKSPKVLLSDTGLWAYLVGLEEENLPPDSPVIGQLVETFALLEIEKQVAWSETAPALLHFRTYPGREVDLVLEDRQRRVVGIEVKSAATVGQRDFAGLRALAEMAGKRFLRGVLLYLGDQAVPFGQGMWALPISSVWQ
jgi:predicted AAA+ superfamily ATPase